jgi:hypothetical protein
MQPTKTQIKFWNQVKEAAAAKILAPSEVRFYRLRWHYLNDTQLDRLCDELFRKVLERHYQARVKAAIRQRLGIPAKPLFPVK